MAKAGPPLLKRIRRKMWGGTFELRVYANGAARIKVDHPSNDPEVEFAMAGATYRVLRETFAKHGLAAPVMGPVSWHDDPPANALRTPGESEGDGGRNA